MKISKAAQRFARQLLRHTLKDGRLDLALAKKFVARVSEEKPRNYIAVLHAYVRLLRLEAAKREALVESATKLSDDLKKTVSADLKKKYGDDLNADFKVDADLLGGMRVRVGSDVWDGSIKRRLEQLRDKLLA
jgi:F-type H+-transporting ATPase subunit delta